MRYVDTRWLSLEMSISRIMTRYKEIIEFFETKAKNDAAWVIKNLRQSDTKIYSQFLQLFLNKINSLNLQFQTNPSMITKILPKFNDFLTTTFNLILKLE